MDPLRPVRGGDPVRMSAQAQNAILAAARRGNMREFGAPDDGSERDDAQILVSSSSALSRFAAFALDTAINTPATDGSFLRLPMFNAKAVTADQPFGITLDPIPAGGVGRGIVVGLVPAQVSIAASTDTFAKINNSLALESASSGYARIVWAAGTSGTQWCLLALPATGSSDWKVKATSSDPTPGYLNAKTEYSIQVDAGNNKLMLVGDVYAPGTNKVYGTDGSGLRTWLSTVAIVNVGT